eukprot:RCo052691
MELVLRDRVDKVRKLPLREATQKLQGVTFYNPDTQTTTIFDFKVAFSLAHGPSGFEVYVQYATEKAPKEVREKMSVDCIAALEIYSGTVMRYLLPQLMADQKSPRFSDALPFAKLVLEGLRNLPPQFQVIAKTAFHAEESLHSEKIFFHSLTSFQSPDSLPGTPAGLRGMWGDVFAGLSELSKGRQGFRLAVDAHLERCKADGDGRDITFGVLKVVGTYTGDSSDAQYSEREPHPVASSAPLRAPCGTSKPQVSAPPNVRSGAPRYPRPKCTTSPSAGKYKHMMLCAVFGCVLLLAIWLGPTPWRTGRVQPSAPTHLTSPPTPRAQMPLDATLPVLSPLDAIQPDQMPSSAILPVQLPSSATDPLQMPSSAVQPAPQSFAAGKDLAEACQAKNREKALSILGSDNPEVNVESSGNMTPLQSAALHGWPDVVKALLEAKADVNRAMKDGSTALYLACAHGHRDIVELLLNNNAGVNLADEDGSTPLYIACENGRRDIAELLLHHKADVHLGMKDGRTPLYTACENGRRDTVELLLHHKAEVDSGRNDGATPLIVAVYFGHADVVALLAEHGADLAVKWNGLSAAEWARRQGHIAVDELLRQRLSPKSHPKH